MHARMPKDSTPIPVPNNVRARANASKSLGVGVGSPNFAGAKNVDGCGIFACGFTCARRARATRWKALVVLGGAVASRFRTIARRSSICELAIKVSSMRLTWPKTLGGRGVYVNSETSVMEFVKAGMMSCRCTIAVNVRKGDSKGDES